MNEEVNVKKYTAVCPRIVILKIILDLFEIKFYVDADMLTSGVYFIHMKTERFSNVKKMISMK